MNGTSNTGAWVVGGLILIVVIGFGVWWWNGDRSGTDVVVTPSPTATTTDTTPAATPIVREDRTNSDVASVIAGIPEASSFASLFASTGVAASISKTGTYTIFVPTNGAFNLLTPGTLTNMSATQKKRLVQYHVVSGRAVDTSAVETSTIMALSKDALNFAVHDPGNSAMVNGAFIIKQYKAKNGIVYLVSGVLVPPEKPLN